MTKPDEFTAVTAVIMGALHGRELGLVLEVLGQTATLAFQRVPEAQRAAVLDAWSRKLAETLAAPRPRLH